MKRRDFSKKLEKKQGVYLGLSPHLFLDIQPEVLSVCILSQFKTAILGDAILMPVC